MPKFYEGNVMQENNEGFDMEEECDPLDDPGESFVITDVQSISVM